MMERLLQENEELRKQNKEILDWMKSIGKEMPSTEHAEADRKGND